LRPPSALRRYLVKRQTDRRWLVSQAGGTLGRWKSLSKILIVDDRPINRELLAQLLGQHQHELLEASDGAEALRVARAEQPDLIISDVLMPTMDGYEFVRQLRADPVVSLIPIIFITGHYLSREARSLADSCGVDYVLYRPCDKDDVLCVVDAALNRTKSPDLVAPAKREEFDRKHLELLTDTLSEKAGELRAMNHKLNALIELSQQMALEHEPLSLVNNYSRVAREIIGAKWNAVGLLSSDEQSLQHFSTFGLHSEIAERISVPSPAEGVFAKLLKDGRSQRIRVLDNDLEAAGLPTDFPVLSSCLGLPIMFQERVYGWLCLIDKLGADEFSDQDEQIAVTLTAQMAAAYENARLYNETRHHGLELEREVAERKRAEEDLRTKIVELAAMTQQFWQASKLATIGELAASIAHELNNPLATISLRTERLLGEVAESDAKRRPLEIIGQETERMANLVSNLLQFSRRDHQQLSTMDITKEIETTLEFIEHSLRSRKINVVLEFAASLPPLHADRQQLRQLFLNLLTNASDAMPQGGTLTVRVAAVNDGANVLVIEFADTGTGVTVEDLARVWEPFFTTKEEGNGTGLGLAICRRIVEEQHGSISIESVVKEGTTLRITFPVLVSEEHRQGTQGEHATAVVA
jgi:signal transduction histidine kinase/CheY-like chemotaxis protein